MGLGDVGGGMWGSDWAAHASKKPGVNLARC
jgi:hypothetical protein